MRKLPFLTVLVLCISGIGLLLSTLASAQDYGYAAQKPIIGGACPYCPWGAERYYCEKGYMPKSSGNR
jgi:hypothetical protein